MALLPTSRSAITSGNETVAFKERITGDPFETLSSWNDSFHHCNWIGITCSRHHPGRVTVVNLVSQSLVEIGYLRRLRFLYLSNNSLTGEIPNNLTSCTELRLFLAERNELVGRIPIQLGSLSKLVILEGSIPISVRLEFLGIMANNFTGPLPNSIANLSTKLTKLYIGMNPISGEIPTGIDNLVSLNGLDMEDNLLTGNIPVSIGNLIFKAKFH
ncbi:hypothetical protein MKW98_018297 [Papaver atlanticum]|uniref:Leucine-rich repeat-containing N-terminal plant-type domain-containing protein n=1 Tax=Papaver atlanticum TaxID=357466 RepID=A0AAD4XS82_9MAGN|nr:hypothetical protein MKW98_018297 [Papaver atlanticum]